MIDPSTPDPFPGFRGYAVIDCDLFFGSPPAGMRLLGNADVPQILGDLEPGEFAYACISDETQPDVVLLRWVQDDGEPERLYAHQSVVCYYGIRDEAILNLVAPFHVL